MPEDITRILLAAEGYLELGMLDHAALELDKATVDSGTGEDVLSLRCQIFMAAKQWAAARDVAKHLVAINTRNAKNWIWAAYATGRVEDIEAGTEGLQRAKTLRPGEPMIDCNLACYACQ